MASKTAFWRVAGLDFNQYQFVAAKTVRAALKEPARTQAKARDVVHYRMRSWNNGVKGDAVIIDSPLSVVAKKA